MRCIRLGPLDNNVYIVVDRETRRGVVVDASDDASRIAREATGVQVSSILITHGDQDHVDALEDLARLLGVPVAAHPLDASRLPVKPDIELQDGMEIEVGALSLRVIHTPGHTPGSVCFYAPGYLLSGDTLFPGGPGNTYGDRRRFDQIIASIQDKLFVLPDDTQVLPGHGDPTTIGNERPYLEEWIARGW
ncbi:MBL fold metallo-hydrolase [Thermobaculum terrenum]|uniref:MBL fold metallo-hydrolase n=1 Tax=Thermobaculum terrenum TaxID=166501 RepID=UPI001F49F3A8|nr:MBL fold metallo-hydrolase [Thermobaculum terrenum]